MFLNIKCNHLPLPQVVEGVVHPGEHQLRTRTGHCWLLLLELVHLVSPSLSSLASLYLCSMPITFTLSSRLSPAQVLALYSSLSSSSALPTSKLITNSLWTFLWLSGGGVAAWRNTRWGWLLGMSPSAEQHWINFEGWFVLKVNETSYIYLKPPLCQQWNLFGGTCSKSFCVVCAVWTGNESARRKFGVGTCLNHTWLWLSAWLIHSINDNAMTRMGEKETKQRQIQEHPQRQSQEKQRQKHWQWRRQ